jgi:diacylglycerol O-acyltransferase
VLSQLPALDAQFLRVEDRRTLAHVGALVVVSPSALTGEPLTLADVRYALEPRLQVLPSLRRRLVDNPLGVGDPFWADDPDFDVEYHLRELGVPGPGTDDQLAEQVARIHAWPLDRARPLWELYLLHGLSEGRVGIYAKMHAAALEESSGAGVLAALLDSSVEPPDVDPEPWEPRRVPSPLELLPDATADALWRPRHFADEVSRSLPPPSALPGVSSLPGATLLDRLAERVRSTLLAEPAAPVTRPTLRPPRTPFDGTMTAHRRFAFASVPLADVKKMKNAFGLTVHDVVLALVTGAVRRWLLDRDALPDAPLVAAVPVSVGHADQAAAAGVDGVVVMRVALPTHLRDAEARLEAVGDDVRLARTELDVLPATSLQDISAVVPTGLAGLSARALLRLAAQGSAPPVNLAVSNVPGPPVPLYVAGAKVEGLHPVPALASSTGGLSVSVFSYDGALDVGLVACRELVPDLSRIAGYLETELAALLSLVD